MTDEPDEVVDAELVDDDHLPALTEPAPTARPIVDQHTVLAPGELPALAGEGPKYTEADFYISQDTADRAARSKSKNTRRNRDYTVERFQAWCKEQGRVDNPCTTATYTEYGAHLIRQGLKATSISAYMSHIRMWQPVGKRPDATRFRDQLATYRREQPRANRRKQSDPIRLPHLMAMLATCDHSPAGLRDAALLACGYGTLARRIELADLLIEDLTITDTRIIVDFVIDKTHQDGDLKPTVIPDRPDIQPVRRLRAWLETLAELGATDGPAFRALTAGGTLQSRTLATERGDHMTGDAINTIVKKRAVAAGLENAAKMTAHGLRAGPTTDLRAAGVTGKRLNRAGRWADESSMPEAVYVRYGEDEEGDALLEIPVYKEPGE
ncbi:tyrosine-type recombinase/integrase [Streptomyces sp. NPDC056817]|uniref:tyrosine-type recombinase/integrase n=1 Tax=Streptomyces sp. NPDC056817 TaxID=3345950 RepID=UPI0036AB296A